MFLQRKAHITGKDILLRCSCRQGSVGFHALTDVDLVLMKVRTSNCPGCICSAGVISRPSMVTVRASAVTGAVTETHVEMIPYLV